MKVREGDKGEDMAPTVMHFRQVRAAKLSSLPVPHYDTQKSFDFYI